MRQPSTVPMIGGMANTDGEALDGVAKVLGEAP
jgi:hypothetical protein